MASRARPRAHTKDDDQQHEEAQLWNKLIPDLNKLAREGTLHTQLQDKIRQEEMRIDADGYDPAISDLTSLEDMYKRSLDSIKKEDENIDSLLSRIGILTALREYTEGGTQERERSERDRDHSSRGDRDRTTDRADRSERGGDLVKDRETLKIRKKRAGGDGDSVTGSSQGRSKMQRSMSASAPGSEQGGNKPELVIGMEVAYRQSKQKSSEAEWIQCVVMSISGEGIKRRYEIRDPVPDETGSHATYKTSANQLIPIPKDSSALVPLPPGKHVLARYPDTTAFYRAEVISTNKRDGICRLKFEGEEEVGKETEVERRLVLDVSAK